MNSERPDRPSFIDRLFGAKPPKQQMQATAGEVPAATAALPLDFAAAADYGSAHGGVGLYIVRGEAPVFEHFAAGRDADAPFALASGSKSLCGVLAAAALADGLLSSYDECIAETVPEWRDDARKSRITVRHLLSMCSGLRFVPPPGISYAAACALPAEAEPGVEFHYNGANFQVFGEILRRKLGGGQEEPIAYFNRRICDPIGLRIDDWRTAGDDAFLPGGASASAREFAKFGSFLLARGHWHGRDVLPPDALHALLEPSAWNPRYGMTFWLLQGSGPLAGGYMAAGLGGQRLYVLPALNLAIVRQARLAGAFGRGMIADMIGGHGFEDAEFLRMLLPTLPR